MKWTQEKLEELYKKVNERGMSDPEFKEKILKDPKGALEEVAGCSLPDDILGVKYIEKENGYANTYVVPDFAQGEIDMTELKSVVGGVGGASGECSAYSKAVGEQPNTSIILIVSVCGAASVPGGRDENGMCGAYACADEPPTYIADVCAAEAE
ncbi:MAG: hypothetical protein ACI4LO_01505 [Anaerovoracaceae bacterium]